MSLLNSPGVFLEIGVSSVKALNGDVGIEVPLERAANGRLTASSRARLVKDLQEFVGRKSWQPRVRAFCAIGARGVSLRRLSLPPTSKEELGKVLLLQIESEFPLSPDELAWGYRQLDEDSPSGANATQDVLVAAVKKEVVEEYATLFAECGLNPAFTVAALARRHVCPTSSVSCAVLDIGREQSEWVSFDNGVPVAVRVVSWGKEDFIRTVAEQLRVSRDDAEKFLSQPEPDSDDRHQPIQQAITAALDSLSSAINGKRAVSRLFLTGETFGLTDLAARLSKQLGGVSCERIGIAGGEGRSAAILGLKKSVEQNDGALPLTLQVKQTNGASVLARPAPTRWLKIAACLAAAAILLPYAEAAVMKFFLSRQVSALNAQTNTLAAISSEFDFLQYLRKNQSPYLDALYLLSKSAPAGTRFDSVSMNRRGELSLRCSMRMGDQAAEFRSKLIDSGFFGTVVLEEQTPTPDRQKVNLRLSAQWKPEGRPTLKVEPPPKDQPSGGPTSPGALPPGVTLPAGVSLPPGVSLPAGVSLPPGVTLSPGAVPPEVMAGAPSTNQSRSRSSRPVPTVDQ